MIKYTHPAHNGAAARPEPVQAPHSYDGIGQALRACYGNDRNPPDPIADAMRRLNALD